MSDPQDQYTDLYPGGSSPSAAFKNYYPGGSSPSAAFKNYYPGGTSPSSIKTSGLKINTLSATNGVNLGGLLALAATQPEANPRSGGMAMTAQLYRLLTSAETRLSYLEQKT